jgi:predicted dehydrogenase
MTSDDTVRPRRQAIKRIVSAMGAATGAAQASTKARPAQESTGAMIDRPFDRRTRVRVGLIGAGVRGIELLANMLPLKSVDVVAVCDVATERARKAAAMVANAGRPTPAQHADADDAWERMLQQSPLDLVVIATPWELHVPMAVGAMRAGAHAAVEIPAATTLDGCWALVTESERARRHCVLLENVCYGQEELLVLGLVRAGVLGEIVHCEGAYIHDLRAQLAEIPPNAGRGAWRRAAHRTRVGDLYPTHGLGPLASYLHLNRGDVLRSLVSVSSREAGLRSFIAGHADKGAAIRNERFRCGDVTTTVLATRLGLSIMLQHSVVGPRPYTRHNLVQGTLGTFAGFPPRIYLDEQRRGPHPEWQGLGELARKFEHPLWSKEGEIARALGGHGGMDYIMMFRLITAITEGRPPDIDVYDAAAWSSVTALSALSIERGGSAVAVPDFTNGAWSTRRRPFLA